jgi:hypothetical protein
VVFVGGPLLPAMLPPQLFLIVSALLSFLLLLYSFFARAIFEITMYWFYFNLLSIYCTLSEGVLRFSIPAMSSAQSSLGDITSWLHLKRKSRIARTGESFLSPHQIKQHALSNPEPGSQDRWRTFDDLADTPKRGKLLVE